MKRYKVNFRDFLYNRIDFYTFVYAKSINDAVRVARLNITMPKYVIADYIGCVQS